MVVFFFHFTCQLESDVCALYALLLPCHWCGPALHVASLRRIPGIECISASPTTEYGNKLFNRKLSSNGVRAAGRRGRIT